MQGALLLLSIACRAPFSSLRHTFTFIFFFFCHKYKCAWNWTIRFISYFHLQFPPFENMKWPIVLVRCSGMGHWRYKTEINLFYLPSLRQLGNAVTNYHFFPLKLDFVPHFPPRMYSSHLQFNHSRRQPLLDKSFDSCIFTLIFWASWTPFVARDLP